MITAGEYRIQAIVAVWEEGRATDPTGGLRVLPPCGYCRQFMRDISEGNLETDVVLGRDKVVELRDLVPYHEWPETLD
jgi:cytidine deaminase